MENMDIAPLVLTGGAILSGDIGSYPSGIIIPVDKPYRWTSADVIRKIKFAAVRHFGKKNLKVGHAGTLDPLATGILLVCIGKATKLAEILQSHDKEYIAGITFGATTPSYDREKEIDRFFPYSHITAEAVEQAAASFTGEQEQIAPLFSAKSVEGVRAYEIARKMMKQNGGEGIDETAAALVRSSRIRIDSIELLDFIPPAAPGTCMTQENSSVTLSAEQGKDAKINVTDNSALGLPKAILRINCSKGTYIRALARDLGEALGSGAHLDSLQRSRSGDFRIKDALSLEEVLDILKK